MWLLNSDKLILFHTTSGYYFDIQADGFNFKVAWTHLLDEKELSLVYRNKLTFEQAQKVLVDLSVLLNNNLPIY